MQLPPPRTFSSGRSPDDRSLSSRACAAVAALATALVFIAAVGWSRDNPLPTFWDEANYFGDAANDYWAIHDRRPLARRVGTLVKTDVGQPPAHRGVLVLTALFGPRPEVLRSASLGGLFVALWFVFSAARRIAGIGAGALAALILLASPMVLASSIRFGTEYTLYVAEAATLYCLVASLRRAQERRRDIVALGLALGLGLWSKPSFVLVALPAVLVTFGLGYRKVCGPPYRWLVKACALGVALGAIYLVPFSLKTLDYVNRSVNGSRGRHSLGEPSLATFLKYVPVVVSTVTGPVVAALLVVTALACVAEACAKRPFAGGDPAPGAAAGVCFAGSALLPLSHFLSGDHDMRYLSGGVVPLSLGVAIVLSRIASSGMPALQPLFALAIFGQIATMLLPIVRETPLQRYEHFQREAVVSNTGNSAGIVFAPQEQWDWSELRSTCNIAALREPSVGYVGAGEPFNLKQFVYAWARDDEAVHATQLWTYTQGPIDWGRTMRTADATDVVLTVPGYRGLAADKQPLDNVNNAAFADRLRRDPHFEHPPLKLTFGRFERTTVLAFINKRTALHCAPQAEQTSNPPPRRSAAEALIDRAIGQSRGAVLRSCLRRSR